MGKKTNVSVYFTWTLLAHWIQILSFINQNGKGENTVEIAKKLPTLPCFDVMYSKSFPSKMDNFPGKISLNLPFWFLSGMSNILKQVPSLFFQLFVI